MVLDIGGCFVREGGMPSSPSEVLKCWAVVVVTMAWQVAQAFEKSSSTWSRYLGLVIGSQG